MNLDVRKSLFDEENSGAGQVYLTEIPEDIWVLMELDLIKYGMNQCG